MFYKLLAFVAVAAPMACHGGVTLRGAVGAKADMLFERRLASATARGDIFDEAVNAFATRNDDLHPYPQGATNHYGWWQGENWRGTDPAKRLFFGRAAK